MKLINELLLKAYRFFFNRNYSYNDMMWVFEQGIHEGKLREHYKNKPNEFIKSDLDYYVRSRIK